MNTQDGPIVTSAAVVLTGEWVEVARQAVLLTVRARRQNGLPPGASNVALAQALTSAMSARGHSDVREIEDVQDWPHVHPTVTVEDAARQLNLSPRQVRRLATQLGGKRIGGRWFLDQTAINEHKQGKT